MKRIIGIKTKPTLKPAPPPGISDCISIVDKRVEEAEKKVTQCQAELKQLNEQIKHARPGHGKQALQQKALRVLQRLRTYEAQAETLRQQSFNMDQATTALQSAKDTQVTVTAMKSGVKEMKKAQKKIGVDDIEDLRDEMAELVATSEEVQDSLARSYTLPDVDDDELQAQFDALGDEITLDAGNEPDGTDVANDPVITESVPPRSGPSLLDIATGGEPLRNVHGTLVDEFGLPNLLELEPLPQNVDKS